MAEELRRLERTQGVPFCAAVDSVLRRGLACGETVVRRPPRFVVRPKATGFAPGVDPLALNRLADETETEAFVAGREAKGAR